MLVKGRTFKDDVTIFVVFDRKTASTVRLGHFGRRAPFIKQTMFKAGYSLGLLENFWMLLCVILRRLAYTKTARHKVTFKKVSQNHRNAQSLERLMFKHFFYILVNQISMSAKASNKQDFRTRNYVLKVALILSISVFVWWGFKWRHFFSCWHIFHTTVVALAAGRECIWKVGKNIQVCAKSLFNFAELDNANSPHVPPPKLIMQTFTHTYLRM